MIKIESRGQLLVYTSIILIVFHILFKDIIILFSAITTITVVIYSLSTIIVKAHWVKGNCRVKPEEINLKIINGEVKKIKIVIESNKKLSFKVKHPIKFCKVKKDYYNSNEIIELEFTPKIAGIYNSNTITLELNSILKIFKAYIDLPLKTNLTIIPKTIALAIKALEIAALIGRTPYEIPLQTIGRGTEYAETREYITGDDLKHIDWKATARLQKLMIKQYHQETSGKTNLILDLKVSGKISRDNIATEFLNNAITLTIQNIPYTITIVDWKNEMKTIEIEDQKKMLLTAVKYALETIELNYTYLYDLIEPKSKREIQKLIEILKGEIEEKHETILKEPQNTIIISCLIGDLTWIINLNEEIKVKKGKLIIHTPIKTWLDSPTLEQSYIDYQKQIKIIRNLKKRGIEIEIIKT